MPRTVKEWIGKNDDTPVPPRVRDRVRTKDGDACRKCSRQLRNEAAQCDHVIPLIAGGENRETNLQTLCRWCHARKTADDVAQKSISYRVRKSHRGIRKNSRPSFATNRDGPFKRRMDGTVVRRQSR